MKCEWKYEPTSRNLNKKECLSIPVSDGLHVHGHVQSVHILYTKENKEKKGEKKKQFSQWRQINQEFVTHSF